MVEEVSSIYKWIELETEEELNLEECLFSDQIFSFTREMKNKTDNNHSNNKTDSQNIIIYKGILDDTLFELKNINKKVFYATKHTNADSVLKNFFTCDISYRLLIDGWNFPGIKYTGLRLLRVNPIEAIFSFLCSQNNHIKRISTMVIYLKEKSNNFKVLNFTEDELKANKFGYRSKYIIKAVKILEEMFGKEIKINENLENVYTKEKCTICIANNDMEAKQIPKESLNKLTVYKKHNICNKNMHMGNLTEKFLDKISKKFIQRVYEGGSATEEDIDVNLKKLLERYLLSIPGIGQKICDCILLMGFSFFDVVPLDIHMLRVSKRIFNLEKINLNKTNYKMINKLWIQRFGKYCGIAQLYLFKSSLDKKTTSIYKES